MCVVIEELGFEVGCLTLLNEQTLVYINYATKIIYIYKSSDKRELKNENINKINKRRNKGGAVERQITLGSSSPRQTKKINQLIEEQELNIHLHIRYILITCLPENHSNTIKPSSNSPYHVKIFN
ncbi:hypothetical protein ACOSP7_031033 [Xanthoceras sorbifolium]